MSLLFHKNKKCLTKYHNVATSKVYHKNFRFRNRGAIHLIL